MNRVIPFFLISALALALDSGIADHVSEVLHFIDANHRAPDGYEGGQKFENREHLLPEKDSAGKTITYQEWDVNPKNPRNINSRGMERLVTGSDGSAFYSPSHYRNFSQLRGTNPLPLRNESPPLPPGNVTIQKLTSSLYVPPFEKQDGQWIFLGKKVGTNAKYRHEVAEKDNGQTEWNGDQFLRQMVINHVEDGKVFSASVTRNPATPDSAPSTEQVVVMNYATFKDERVTSAIVCEPLGEQIHCSYLDALICKEVHKKEEEWVASMSQCREVLQDINSALWPESRRDQIVKLVAGAEEDVLGAAKKSIIWNQLKSVRRLGQSTEAGPYNASFALADILGQLGKCDSFFPQVNPRETKEKTH